MVDERIRDSVVEKIKQELQIQPNKKYYLIDSVEFKSGPIFLPVQGITKLKNDLETQLTTTKQMMYSETFKISMIKEALSALLIIAWQHKSKIITAMSAILFVYTRIRSHL